MRRKKKKKSYCADITGLFLPEGYRTECRQGPEPVPSTSGVSGITACLPSPVADDLSALPSPTSSTPPVSSAWRLTGCLPLYASSSNCTIVLFKVRTIGLKMFSLFFVFYALLM